MLLTNDGFLLEGTLFFNRLNQLGVLTGLVTLPGVAKLSIKLSSDIKDQISKDKGQYGQVIASVAIPKPTELSISLNNGTKDGVALALMGTSSITSSGGGTATAEAVTASLGFWINFINNNITAGSVMVTNTGAITTYIENTDYEINYALGMIRAIPGGAITDTEALKVSYAYGAKSGWQVQGGTLPQAKGVLILDGRNLVNNKSVKFEAFNVLLVADGDFMLIGDDITNFSLSGRMLTPSGMAEPFTIDQW